MTVMHVGYVRVGRVGDENRVDHRTISGRSWDNFGTLARLAAPQKILDAGAMHRVVYPMVTWTMANEVTK
jgi:hypothetical protein